MICLPQGLGGSSTRATVPGMLTGRGQRLCLPGRAPGTVAAHAGRGRPAAAPAAVRTAAEQGPRVQAVQDHPDRLLIRCPVTGDDRDTCETGHGLMWMCPAGPDLRLVTSVIGGEVVKRVGFVLFGGQAVLPGGVQAGVPHELGDHDADGDGLIGHAGAVLLRKLADQCGLTSALGAALTRAGKFPLIDRGVTLVSMAVAIALGATSMSDIALLDHQGLVFGPPPSDTTVRRTLELADDKTLRKVAKARAKIRAHVWKLVAATTAGFPWLAIAGKVLTGWLVIDMDATLITAHSDKEGAAPTFKKGYGFHPLGAWLANTSELLAMLLRPGNAGSNRLPITCGSWARHWRRSQPDGDRSCWSGWTAPAPLTTSLSTCCRWVPGGARCCSPAGG